MNFLIKCCSNRERIFQGYDTIDFKHWVAFETVQPQIITNLLNVLWSFAGLLRVKLSLSGIWWKTNNGLRFKVEVLSFKYLVLDFTILIISKLSDADSSYAFSWYSDRGTKLGNYYFCLIVKFFWYQCFGSLSNIFLTLVLTF